MNVIGGFAYYNMGNKAIDDETAVIFDGLYDRIEGSTKAVVLEQVKVGATEYGTIVPTFFVSGTNFVANILLGVNATAGTMNVLHLQVTDDDEVTGEVITVTFTVPTE